MDKILKLLLNGHSVEIDSRCEVKDKIFFALKGENFDGNTFAIKALENGAIIAIVDDPKLKLINGCFYVKDSLKALQNLASIYRRQFQIPVIAITGTNGKTTTKELVSITLSSKFKCHSTKGNFNNHIGVPLTLLNMPKGTEVVVIEMGANHIGEIATLCNIAEPTHGLITNVGKAHLEGFGDLDGVIKAKGEMYQFLSDNNGTVFINASEPSLMFHTQYNIKNKIYYGSLDDNAIVSFYVENKTENAIFQSVGFVEDKKDIQINSNLIGSYNFQNLSTAINIGRYFKVESDKMKSVIEAYFPSNNRVQFIRKVQNTIILDAYNANPSSVESMLEAFAQMDGKKMLILGDMLELGSQSRTIHEEFYKKVINLKFDKVLFVGAIFNDIIQKENSFVNVDALKLYLKASAPIGFTIWIKGSRGIALEKCINNIS